MRSARWSLLAAVVCFALPGPSWSGTAPPSSCQPNGNVIDLDAAVDASDCPSEVTATPDCLETYYTPWPTITWKDATGNANLRWRIEAVPGYAHDHFATLAEFNDQLGAPSKKGRQHGTQECVWHYTVTAIGPGGCSASLDPGIKFKPGGGTSPLALVLIAGATLAIAYIWRRRRKKRA